MDIPKEFLSKEFLSQFKTGEDVTAFMKELHTRVYEQMLEAEQRWENLLFRFPVIEKVNLSQL